MSRLDARPYVSAGFALLLSLAATPAVSSAQAASAAPTPAADRAAVMGVVKALFDAMRAGDSAAVRAQFHPRAQLSTAAMNQQGTPVVRIDSLESFVRAVGTPHADVWDEKIRNEIVQVDGPLASVWVDYAFFTGTKFSHCGVDAFQLGRTTAGWRIIALADTRKREGCNEASWK